MGAGDPGGWGGPGTGTRTGGGTSRSGGGSPSPCTYDPVSLAEAKSFAHGSLPAEKGKGTWELIACIPPATAPGIPVYIYWTPTLIKGTALHLYWVAFGAPQPAGVVRVSPRRLAIDVFAEKRLPYPAPLGISPDEVNGVPNETVVNAGTWLWIPAGEWHPVSVTASIPDYLSVTATGRPVALTWRMSDGGSVTCDGPGTPYYDAAGNDPSPTCNYVYAHSTPVGPITASITWQVSYTWQYAGGGSGSGTLPDVITSATGRLGAVQVETINVPVP